MTSQSTSLTLGRSLAPSCITAILIVSFLLSPFLIVPPLAYSAATPGPVNIGTDDDPYYVADSAALETLKSESFAPAYLSALSAASTIVRIGSWTTGLTHTAGAGSDRLLMFAVGYENSTDVGVSTVSYGGQALTRIGGVVAGTSSLVRSELWYLKETGIAAAGSTTFTVTWGGTAPTSPKYGAATYANVNQSSPIGSFAGSSINASTPNPITTTLTVAAGGMSIGNAFCGNTGSYTWNNSFVEGFDQSASSSNMSAADRAEAAAGSSIPSATHSGPNRQVLFAAALLPVGTIAPLDSLNITGVDPSLFPQICFYVEALDPSGNPVGGLTPDSFCVYQDMTRLNTFTVQQLTVDSCRTAVCLVIDVSGSMASDGKLTAAKNAASRFVRNMDIFDRTAIVKFSDCYTVVQNFTSDTTLLLNAITALTAAGRTAYFDGVWEGVTLTIPELGSKAVINLTDGLENNSGSCGPAGSPDGLGDGFADDSTLIVNLALGAGIPVYSITLGGGFDPQYAQKLANGTGGAYYNAPSNAQLDGIYDAIKSRLCSRYKICYNSPDTIQNGDCHDVIVCHQTTPNVCVDCDTAEYCEKVPPKIKRTPATIALDNTCQRWGTQVQLCAWVTDADTPLNQLVVTLFYRNSNIAPYTSVVTSRTDSTFCAYVPASQLLCGGDSIQYYFTAFDGSLTVASPANAPTGHHAFPICPNHAPVCNTPNDTTITQCTPLQVCLPVSGADQDGNLQACVKQSGPGTLSGGNWCYTPSGSGVVSVTIRCTDSCGLYCEKTFNVTFAVNGPPVCTSIADTSYFQCAAAQVCRPVGATDPNGNLTGCAVVSGPGTVSGGNWCYTPSGDETVNVTIRCTDACGAYCEEPFSVTFVINDPPVCNTINDTSYFQCAPAQVCRPVGATDPNGNLTGCAVVSGPGSVSGGNWCYTPSGDETVNVTIRCTDACGAYCEEPFSVTFVINDPPVCNTINDTSYFQCTPTQVCRPVGATDPNGNLSGCAVVSGPGTVSGGNWCYTPSGDETVNVTIRCTDACGAYCEEPFSVTFVINDPPVCNPVSDTSYFQCAPAQVCRPVGATDPNGNLTGCAVVSGPGTVSGGNWCYTPSGDETINVTIRCTDACGAYCEEPFSVTFVINDPPICNPVSDTSYFQCAPAQVCRPVGATDPNGNLTGCVVVGGPGTVTGGNWCYTPSGDETVNVTIRCTDACGAYCEESFSVEFVINDPPVCNTINDTSYFQCAPAQVCRPVGATDPNGNLTGCAVVSGPGSVSGGNWCYTPSGDETVNVTIRCTDACGAYCEEPFSVTFVINDPPVCNTVNDTSYFQCVPTQVCRPVGATDPNGNLTGCAIVSGPGALSGGNWCYTPSGDETVNVTIRCTDACGAYCEESFSVEFIINDPPVCDPVGDTSYFQCVPTQVCRPVGATDPNGNLTGCAVVGGPGTVTGGNWCYTPSGDETANVTIRCTDACGDYCDESFSVTFEINDAPVINLGNDISVQQNFDGDTVCQSYSVSDPQGLAGLIEMLVSAPAGIYYLDTAANKLCFVPSSVGTFEIVAKVTDSCGAVDYDTLYIIVSATSPPVCNLPGDESVLQCVPAQICRPVSATSMNPPVTCVKTSGPGTLSGGQWCYTPAGDEVVTVSITCTDDLGATCNGTFTITFDINDAPECHVPNDTSIFQCVPAQVCLPVSATDVNGNLTGCVKTGGPGTLSGGNWCYTPSGDETVNVTVRCTDACGLYCEETFSVTFAINEPPVCTVPNDTTIFQCAPAPVCLPVSATDADGNLTGCVKTAGPGVLNGNWCYTPAGDEVANVTIRCTDACGAFCEKTFKVTFVINDAPVCSVPNDTSIFQCAPTPVCLPVSATDANGNLAGCVVFAGPGVVSGGNWCYTPSANGMVTVTIRCTDSCGAFCDKSFSVTFSIDGAPTITCPGDLLVTCATLVPACNPADATVIGGAGTVIVTCSSSNNGGAGCPASPLIYTYTYTATDSCGGTDQCERRITVIDNIAPILVGCPGNVTIQCGSPLPPRPVVTATDNCDTSVPVTLDTTLNLTGCGGNTGTITRVWTAVDDCGNRASCTQVITIQDTQSPVCSIPPGPFSYFQCTPTPIAIPVSATDNCDASVTCAVVVGPGSVVGGNWTYTPSGDASFSVTIRCTDDCNNTCEGSFSVTVNVNDPPTIAFGPDVPVFQCTPAAICVTYTVSDPNGLNASTETLVSGPPGAAIDPALNRVCFTPAAAGTYTIIARVADSCNATDQDTINVTVTLNGPPTIAFGPDIVLSQCIPGPVCVNYTPSDPNGNSLIETLVSGPAGATINTVANQVCFTPPSTGVYTIIARVEDPCGAFDLDTVQVTVTLNRPPVLTVPRDTSFFQCSPTQVCLPVSAIDPDGGPITISKISGLGTLAGGQWCFTPAGDQSVTVTVRATDTCGATDEKTFVVTFNLNDPPQCIVPNDFTIRQNCVPQQVELPVSSIDPDNNAVGCTVVGGPGAIINNRWVYTPTGPGQVCVTIRCTDACGAACERSFCVVFEIDTELCGCRFVVSVGDGDGTVEALNGTQVVVPIRIDSVTGEIGGFDFLLCYDQSALLFLKATIGDALDGWEYWTYRYSTQGNCTGGCPSGFIRLVAIANMNNGIEPPSSVYTPVGDIADLIFQVSPNRNLIHQCIPIRFCWINCGDNTIASRSGDTTWVDHLMVVDTCQSNPKTDPVPGICFSTGYICIIEPPDDRGDLNLNNIANEVGDAVLFTNYFIYGSSVWTPPYEETQILASDINDDGVVLTVADLIYLIRIVTGDAQPFPPGGHPKLSPYANAGTVVYRVENDGITVSTTSPVDLGGALFVFRHSGLSLGSPSLTNAASGMTMRSRTDGDELRVLVYPSWEADLAAIGAGTHDVLFIPTAGHGSVELVEVQLSDREGALMSASSAQTVMPTEYALSQNYPNPFNAGTVISFDLPEAGRVNVSVFNVLGQTVRVLADHDVPAGKQTVVWDGRDENGRAVASGLYFYRLQTNRFTATKKMMLVK